MNLLYVLLLLLLLCWTYYTKKLTLAGSLTAGFVAVAIFLGTEWTGIALLGTFFFLGTAATSWKKNEKIKERVADEQSSRRNAGQVLANGGMGALMGLLAWQLPQYRDTFLIMLAGAFSAATADTLSSELGVLYGRKFYNIRTFKPDLKGLDGVVSLEGTLLGVAGSLLIGGVFLVFQPVKLTSLALIIFSGLAGNFLDSYLGATLERKGKLGNDLVNTLNTVAGALLAGLLYSGA